MTDDLNRITELWTNGVCCSQVMAVMALESQGKANPDLVRAMKALCGGFAGSGDICGTLTGAGCALSMFAAKGTEDETGDPQLDLMLTDLVDWFKSEYETLYGGIRCETILEGDSANTQIRCPVILTDTWEKVKEILREYGYARQGTDT